MSHSHPPTHHVDDSLLASISVQPASLIPNPNLNPTTTLPLDSANNLLSLLPSHASNDLTNESRGIHPLHVITPLTYSPTLSSRSGHHIFLKLDALQPSGSFKMRGIGAECQAAYRRHGDQTHIIIASGGNAGLAAATASKTLGVKCTVFLPTSTEPHVVDQLESLGAKTTLGGSSWTDSDQSGRKFALTHPESTYVHAFEGQDLIRGHSTLPKEIYQQFGEERGKFPIALNDATSSTWPEVIISSTGGGGLLHGILQGLTDIEKEAKESGKDHTPPLVISCQDQGTNSLNKTFDAALKDNNITEPITLDAITSLATSMGCRTCGKDNFTAAVKYSRDGTLNTDTTPPTNPTLPNPFLSTLTLDDSLSAISACNFYRDHSLLIEIACGASLVPIYEPALLEKLLENRFTSKQSPKAKNVVVVVCGGSKVDLEMLEGYRERWGEELRGRATVDGVEVLVG